MNPTHIPVLRHGTPYRSLEQHFVSDCRTGEPLATVSMANTGMIREDLGAKDPGSRALRMLGVDGVIAIAEDAARRFLQDELPIDEATQHGPEDHLRILSATTGLPLTLCRGHLAKVHHVLTHLGSIHDGLTRGLDRDVLGRGHGNERGATVSFVPECRRLGVVLPSNSPGVHALWIPALAMLTSVALKPGSNEPWTALRILQALLAAGLPPEAVGHYPCDHGGAIALLESADRGMIFGDRQAAAPWVHRSRVEVHGPGLSKIILGAEASDRWEEHSGWILESMLAGGGRSCINASSLLVDRNGRDIAQGLARRVADIQLRGLDDPEAVLAGFPSAEAATRLHARLVELLEIPGAEDLTSPLRNGERIQQVDGMTALLPLVVHITDPDHPLARSEFPFPFLAVTEARRDWGSTERMRWIGATLALTALTDDPVLRQSLLRDASIHRLHLGPIPTTQVAWDQPHEGNLFTHLYRRRAIAIAGALP